MKSHKGRFIARLKPLPLSRKNNEKLFYRTSSQSPSVLRQRLLLRSIYSSGLTQTGACLRDYLWRLILFRSNNQKKKKKGLVLSCISLQISVFKFVTSNSTRLTKRRLCLGFRSSDMCVRLWRPRSQPYVPVSFIGWGSSEYQSLQHQRVLMWELLEGLNGVLLTERDIYFCLVPRLC